MKKYIKSGVEELESDALHRIYDNINSGERYGYFSKALNDVVGDYLFSEVLSATSRYIRYSHYGSSATKNTIANLRWILKTIFKMTPEEFESKYTLYSAEEEDALNKDYLSRVGRKSMWE